MSSKSEEFIATARKRFEEAAANENDIRLEAVTDLRYVAGEQWDDRIKQDRNKAGRPALTFPRCHTFVQQVSNEARQNKPQIKYIPGDGSDKDTAEVYEGLARHIQYDSDAQVAYETAVEYSAGGSFGYYRFLTEYVDDDSWDQELKVVPVLDPFSVYGVLIPSCFGVEPKFAFIIEEISHEDFEKQYPKSEIIELGFDKAGQRAGGGWVGTDTIRIAEYWYVEETPEELTRENPDTGEKETRTVQRSTVKFCKMNGLEVLPNTETTWPGYCIPIIPVLGKQLIIDGKAKLFSVVRFQRDPQQLINLYKTRIAETLATAPIQPYLAAEGQIAGHEQEWANMNRSLTPVLTYKVQDIAGHVIGEPKRQVFEAPIASLSEAAAQEIDDMKATAGIFDASLGAKGNETSGQAILRRQQQSNITNLHFMDNLERAFKKGGVVLADVIPKVYDAPRMIRILGPDETPKIVKVNQQWEDDKGQKKHYKIGGEGVGKYDVLVTMGKGFSSKRMESFDMMTQVLQGNPDLLPMIGDIFFKNSDLAGADQLAERFKKMLPPNLQDDEDGQPIPPQAKAAIAQSQMQLQALNEYAKQIEGEKKQLEFEKQAKVVDNQFKLETTKLTLENQLAIAEINTKAQNERERVKLEYDLNAKLHVSAHEVALQADSQAHDAGIQAIQQAHESDMADKTAAIQSAQSAQDAEQQSQMSSGSEND